MDVFGIALAAGRDLLRDAAIDAAYELGIFDRLPWTFEGSHRLRALVDLLVAIGVLAREGERLSRGDVPPRPAVARAGWGLMADVIRRDQPLPVEGGEIELRYHAHLARVGAPAARELAALLARGSRDDRLLDLGAGAGTYTAAWLDAQPSARATVVDYREVIALARTQLARFGDRVQFVASDARTADVGAHDVVLLVNVLHLHDARTCAQLVASAARAVKPGGRVAIKDLRVDDGRRGPFEGLAFALNMAIYTGGGDVYETSQLRAWLADAGLVGLEEHRLASQPDGIVLIGHRPRGARAAFAATTGLDADPDAFDGAMPLSFRTMLAHAVAQLRRTGADDEAENLVAHYTRVMPRLRAEMLQAELFRMPLEWSRLQRLSRIFDRLAVALPKPPTLGALYERTHYGGFMPLLYGYPADLAYFTRRGRELGLDALGTIDRYLAAPILHELCHFARDRDALLPPHLDECIAGWIGVHVWPELAYPEGDHDDAIYAAPWLSQVGQAVARAFGVDAVLRAHRGDALWDAVLPKPFLDAATAFGWADWCERRTPHFLSDTLDPDPWIALVWEAIAARPDPDFDRQIVRDALCAMCLANSRIDGSFRTRTALPAGPITIDARACRVTAPLRGDVDRVAPRYWLPPAVGARLVARGIDEQRIELASLAELDAAVDELTR